VFVYIICLSVSRIFPSAHTHNNRKAVHQRIPLRTRRTLVLSHIYLVRECIIMRGLPHKGIIIFTCHRLLRWKNGAYPGFPISLKWEFFVFDDAPECPAIRYGGDVEPLKGRLVQRTTTSSYGNRDQLLYYRNHRVGLSPDSRNPSARGERTVIKVISCRRRVRYTDNIFYGLSSAVCLFFVCSLLFTRARATRAQREKRRRRRRSFSLLRRLWEKRQTYIIYRCTLAH